MGRTSGRWLGAALAALAVGAGAPAAQAAAPARAQEVRDTGADYNAGKPLPLRAGRVAAARSAGHAARARARKAAAATPPVGTVRTWLALDDVQGSKKTYLKDYTLRVVGRHLELWVANDTNFPGGDCRNGVRTQITDEQATYLAQQFDEKMYPVESRVFSVPPERDGSKAAEVAGVPADYWSGDGDKIVTLVDNVRDSHYYDTNNAGNQTYIAGFFYSVFNKIVDRNVMTIDAYDWLHRTGANPSNEPSSDLCQSAPARAFLYEGVFAHEYQHLLESYQDADEMLWINEGLSDWAMTLTGYQDTRKPITDQDFADHIQCFLGFLGVKTPANPNPRDGGPENSLTLWGDQGDDEILCDYGAESSMMELLAGRYGTSLMTTLHREKANGLPGLARALGERGFGRPVDRPTEILHDWAAAIALDGVIDRGAELFGRGAARLTVPTLDASVNWAATDAYDSPGAPPNGSDYVRLRDGAGAFLDARELRSLHFDGAETLEPRPVEWTVDADPEGRPGDPALTTGVASSLDRAIVREVAVPAEAPTLTFQTRWDTEPGWDFGVVQVSTDGGKTYTSLANADTTSEHDPGAEAGIVAQLPGFTGESGGWRTEGFDLSAYAGTSILLAFRYRTDASTEGAGWWIDDVRVGGTVLTDGALLEGWQSPTQVRPIPVGSYTVQLLGYTSATQANGGSGDDVAFVRTLPIGEGSRVSLLDSQLRRLTRGAYRADVVAAIVTQDDPTESVDQYARYTLAVNGITQPGG